LGKDPAVLFYTSDYLTGTALFNYEQKGKYSDLLFIQHQTGHIPPEDFKKISGNDPKILKKFVQDKNSYFYNKRMEYESLKRKNYCGSRKANRLKSKINHKKHMSDTCKTYVPHMENENRNKDKDVNRDKNKFLVKDSFEQFWIKYHEITGLPKTEKDPAFRYWKPLTIADKEAAYKNIQPYFESLRESKYCKKARTYLGDKNFNDEFNKPQQKSAWD